MEDGRLPSAPGHSAEPEPVFAVSAQGASVPSAETVVITREVYDFLMGVGPLEGVWFNDLHKGLPGRFWWRGVLASAAGWPAQGTEAGTAETTEIGSVHDGPVA